LNLLAYVVDNVIDAQKTLGFAGYVLVIDWRNSCKSFGNFIFQAKNINTCGVDLSIIEIKHHSHV
jgi:hypothetical protein